MKGFEIVAVVIGAFFIAGIAVGILLVVALPLFKSVSGTRRRRTDPDDQGRRLPLDDGDEQPFRWPGG